MPYFRVDPWLSGLGMLFNGGNKNSASMKKTVLKEDHTELTSLWRKQSLNNLSKKKFSSSSKSALE